MMPTEVRSIATNGRNPNARMRLICFANAGGSASMYRLWGSLLGPEVDVCAVELPGHWARLDDTLITNFPALIEALGPDVASLLDRPYHLFGFSLGTLVAFATARWLRRHHHPMPLSLICAGRAAPEFGAAHGVAHLAQMSDAAFIDVMQASYGGISQAVLNEPELMAMALPILRADMQLLDTHRVGVEPPLDCPIHVLGGDADRGLTAENLAAWRAYTTQAFSVTRFAGAHHFIEPSRAAVIDYVRRHLGVSAP